MWRFQKCKTGQIQKERRRPVVKFRDMDKEILTAKLAALQPATKTPPVISTEPDSSDSDDSKSSDDDEDPITQLTTSFQSLDFNIDDEINLSSPTLFDMLSPANSSTTTSLSTMQQAPPAKRPRVEEKIEEINWDF